jgi:hypothetical protein
MSHLRVNKENELFILMEKDLQEPKFQKFHIFERYTQFLFFSNLEFYFFDEYFRKIINIKLKPSKKENFKIWTPSRI